MIAMGGLVCNYKTDCTDRWVDEPCLECECCNLVDNSLGNWEPMQGL